MNATPPAAATPPVMNYTYEQVRPIVDRILAATANQTPAQILAVHDRALKAFTFKSDNYTLIVLAHGIVLQRDGVQIHASNATVTKLSSMLRKSFR